MERVGSIRVNWVYLRTVDVLSFKLKDGLFYYFLQIHFDFFSLFPYKYIYIFKFHINSENHGHQNSF